MKYYVVLICVFLFACQPAPQSESFHAFGTEVTIQLEDVSAQRAKELFSAIDQQLQMMHKRWHAWQDSELSAIREACQTGTPVIVSEDIAYLLQQGQLLEQESLGYFNPAMGELIDAWGFLSHASAQDRVAPDDQRIHELLSYHPSMEDLQIEHFTVSCNNPHVRLDFGAYAKGYGIGQIVNYLRAQGVEKALVNAGGDLMILQPSGSKPKRIGIASPDHDNPIEVLSLTQSTSVFTSGTYARLFKDPNTQKTFHHLINPKTGRPSTDFVSVTVVHPDPLRADAAATALLASDKDSWLAIAEQMGIDTYLLITTEGERIDTLHKDLGP